MRRVLLWIVALVVLVPVGFTVVRVGWMQINPAEPGPAALEALQPGRGVDVSRREGWLVFTPPGGPPATGLILYPGANCDIRGYAPLLRALAEAGYLAVGIQMPLRLSILDPEAAAEVPPAFPEVARWILAGHSMGGAVGGGYAHDHPERLAGAILLDAYPLESDTLADSPIPVWHIHRARADGSPPAKFAAMRHVFPDEGPWVPIRGGNHMQFGSFVGGTYDEEWDAQITEAEQLRRVKAAVLRAALAIAPPGEALLRAAP